jgi:hypothetical protein
MTYYVKNENIAVHLVTSQELKAKAPPVDLESIVTLFPKL